MAGLAQESDSIFPAIVSAEINPFASKTRATDAASLLCYRENWPLLLYPASLTPCLVIFLKPTTLPLSKIDGQSIGCANASLKFQLRKI
jgi:hypothetical protein